VGQDVLQPTWFSPKKERRIFTWVSDECWYLGYHISWTRQRGMGGGTMNRLTQPKGMGQVAHNRGSLEDNYRIKSYKYGK
jgi:hypothetical protein